MTVELSEKDAGMLKYLLEHHRKIDFLYRAGAFTVPNSKVVLDIDGDRNLRGVTTQWEVEVRN